MNKKKFILASTLAILIAPSILGNVSTSTSVKADTINNPIGTVDYGGAETVDENGNLNGITLPVGSSWKLGKTIGIGTSEYYQVGTNEYINKKNVEVAGTFTDIGTATPVNTTINLYNSSAILDDNGNNTGKTLPANSSWHADQTKAMHNYLYYRVATNEWVSNGGYNGSEHIFANGPIAVTLTKDVQLYDTSTNSLTRILPKGSSWRTNASVQNGKGQYFAQVSNNEWIPLSDGIFADYTNGNTIENGIKYAAALEPTFATDISK